MRRMMLLLAASVVAACQAPMPAANPQMAWVDFSTPFPNDRLLLAERLDKQRLSDGRFFEVSPGRHELIVRFDYEVTGGGGMGMMGGPTVRVCYLTIHYEHFEAGQRYVLEGRSMAMTPEARLYNAKREIVAEVSDYYCLM
ncbi:PA0061/PA0062 family lipoprotein [Pseudomonas sp. 210_17 TE3656]